MARKAVGCLVQTRLDNGVAVVTTVARPADPINGASTATDKTAVDTDVATLVADGASPTQAHVTTLNTDWTALKADIAAVPAQIDVLISYDAAVVVDKSTLRQAVDYMLASLPETL